MHTFLECGGQLAFVKHKVEIQSCPFLYNIKVLHNSNNSTVCNLSFI